MKRIILAVIVAMSFFAAEAQTTTKSKSKKAKKTTVTAESKAKAKQKAHLAKVKKQTEQRIEEMRASSFLADSLRLDSERLAADTFEMSRKAYLETRYKQIDSTNQASWKKYGEDKEQWSKTEHSMDVIIKEANLNSYQGRQIKIINQTYNDRARLVKANADLTEADRAQQLVSLNNERKARIQAVVGKAKERKLEKERKEYAKKFGEDAQAKWMDEAETMAKNK